MQQFLLANVFLQDCMYILPSSKSMNLSKSEYKYTITLHKAAMPKTQTLE